MGEVSPQGGLYPKDSSLGNVDGQEKKVPRFHLNRGQTEGWCWALTQLPKRPISPSTDNRDAPAPFIGPED